MIYFRKNICETREDKKKKRERARKVGQGRVN